MNNEHKKLPTFGKRPLLPVGTGAPTGTRCMQIQIPDDDMAARQLLGTLRLLTFWQSFERDASHLGTEWAIAWRDALAASVGQEECVTRTELRADDICTLSWSYDDWVTFESYDPSACILANIDSVVPGMIAQAIQDAIADGTLQQPDGQPAPENPPEPGGCRTIHLKLFANSAWVCPFPVSAGYTIQITNATGATNDGSGLGAIGRWNCPDGSRFAFSRCYGDQITEETDPLPTSYHMIPIANVDGVWFDPATTYTVPEGVTDEQLTLQVNDSSLADNLGDLSFDLTVCTSGWSYTFDFTTGMHGWHLDTGYGGSYQSGVGFVSSAGGGRAQNMVVRYDTFPETDYIDLDYVKTGSYGWSYTRVGPMGAVQKTIATGEQTINVELPAAADDGGDGYMQLYGDASSMTLVSVTLHGNGVNPFI